MYFRNLKLKFVQIWDTFKILSYEIGIWPFDTRYSILPEGCLFIAHLFLNFVTGRLKAIKLHLVLIPAPSYFEAQYRIVSILVFPCLWLYSAE